MADVYIIGIDMIPFGRFPDKAIENLAAEAVLLALRDCNLSMRDMQAFYCGNMIEAANMVGQRTLRLIGKTGIPVVNVANACATGATAFREGVIAIENGAYDLVLTAGVEKMGKGLIGGVPAEGFVAEGVLGSDTNPAMFSLLGMEHQGRYGTSFEQFAKVAVKNHWHSTFNPKAMYRVETPLEQVMNSEMISYPNTKLMCSINVDGAAAAVLASGATVRRLGLEARAVRVLASEMTSDPFDAQGMATTDFNLVTRLCAAKAYETAGFGPGDLDVVELHDCFATAELLHYENLGLCASGEAGRLIDEGETSLGGRLPVNVSGGLLSKGHPLGATGIANICEISLQLRGEAGGRQVENASVGLTHVVGGAQGWGSCCAIHILSKN